MPVEFISNLVGNTVNEFIDMALAIVTVLMVWYIIKFFIVEPKGKDESTGELGELIKKKWGEKKEKAEKESKRKDREKHLDPIRGFIIHAENHAEDMADALHTKSASAFNHAKSELSTIRTNISSARRALRAAKIHFTGDLRNDLQGLHHYVETTLESYVSTQVKGNMPTNITVLDWDTKVRTTQTCLRELRTRCGYVLKTLDKLIEKGEYEAPTAPGTGPGPYGGRGTI
ncbi:MAG TPA: hypothetical protein VJA23_05045 [Candidatus Nanoarchaeia archaeon]|nr:hypothetical protein [Candidatus Nanoarchaeia archaeon]